MNPSDLHPLYYLHNFTRAVQWVHARYGDILQEDEQAFIAQFGALPATSQALLVRLLMRKGPWFRASKLVYSEIGDLAQAAAPLLQLGWLRDDQPLTLAQWCALHTKSELQAQFAERGVLPSMRKAQMQAHLESVGCEAEQPASAWSPDSSERIWCVMVDALCDRLRLMFFGNLYQDWSEFVLADLGVYHYEVVPLHVQSRAFQSCGDVDAYVQLQAIRTALQAATVDAQALKAQLLQAEHPNPWLERRRHKLLLQLGQHCEKQANWQLAEQTYAICQFPGARIRHIRVLEHLQQWEAAWALAQQAHAAPHSEEEAQKLARMLPRLQRAMGMKAARRKALSDDIAQLRTDIALPRPQDRSSVEWVLRAHWHTEDAPVYYVENTLINALFGLLFWPAIFAPVQGAFFHPFQREPADFAAPDFVQRRSHWFAQGMAQLEDGSYQQAIKARFHEKYGLQSPYVVWPALSALLIATALHCIPAAHLQRFFARMLDDVKGHRSGFPDLVRFWPAQQRYELVEVKAPGDKLQDNQIRWLHYCIAHGMPVQVCHVHWLPAVAPAASEHLPHSQHPAPEVLCA